MPVSFNLVEEPFIPCVLLGGRAAEYGLRDVLLGAHEIAEVRDGSPLVTVALHRLLLAVVHRCYRGPKDNAARLAIRKAGAFDASRLADYFGLWGDRFDLFGERYPFYQLAGYSQPEPSGANRLTKDLSRGNNPLLFDHTTDDPPPALSPAGATRALIAEQLFAFSAGRGRKGEPHTLDGPIGRAVEAFALGDSLFETLWLNLTIYNPGEGQPIPCDEDDAPVWEREPVQPYGDSVVPRGYLDYLTWQSRTVRLHPESNGDRVVVRRVSYSQGRVWRPGATVYDPFVAYERDRQAGDRPVLLQDDRDLWRDSAALFQFAETDQFVGPLCLHTLGTLVSQGVLDPSKRYRVLVAGARVESGQPTIRFWRHETLPLPVRYLDDPSLVGRLKDVLRLSEEVADGALRAAADVAARRRLQGESGTRPDGRRVRALVDSFAPERVYWSRLELPFRGLLVRLAAEGADRDACLRDWFWGTLRPAAVAAFDGTVGRVDGGRDLKAVTAGRATLFGRLTRVRAGHHIPDREKEGAA